MRTIKLIIYISLLFSASLWAQTEYIENGVQPDRIRSDQAPPDPFGIPPKNPDSRAIWDVQFDYDASAAGAEQAGAETDGTYLYTTTWTGNKINKFDKSGTFIESFTISGVTGLRDLAYDGTYFYGGSGNNKIYKMNFTAKTLIATITLPTGIIVRGIAQDNSNSGMWVCDWATDIICFNKTTGASIDTIPAINHGLTHIYGLAYDSWSAGGPFLWIFDQGGNGCDIYQLDLNTELPTGVWHDATADVADDITSPLAGGLFTTSAFETGIATLGGLCQGVPNAIFGYELTTYGPYLTNDVGVQYILEPYTDFNLTSTEPVTIKVRNYGSASQTNIPVSFTIDNSTPVNETITATIDSGQTFDYTFTQTANLSKPGKTYLIHAQTDLSNDQRHANNSRDVEVLHKAARYQNIVAAEYFINTDPGQGNGTSISGSYNQPDVTVNVNNVNVPVGSTVYVRFKSENGTWSKPEAFKRRSYFTNWGAVLQNGEYFVNTDPGVGNGTALTFTNGIANITNLNLPVGSTAYVRVKDNFNRWSRPNSFKRPLALTNSGATLAGGEYFINTDPGIGNGTAVTYTNGVANINNLNLPVGSTFYVRAKDSFGRWSRPYPFKRPVNLTNRGATLAIGEYFINTDPGLGNGISLTFTNGIANLTNFNLPAGSTLYIRAKDSFGRWSYPYGFKRPAMIQNRGATLAGEEYFINTDPGKGNANPVTFINGIATLTGLDLTKGDVVYLRVKDSYNRWSNPWGTEFSYYDMQRAEYRIKLVSGGTFTTPQPMVLSPPNDSTNTFIATKTGINWNWGDSIYVRFQTELGMMCKWKAGIVVSAGTDKSICEGTSTSLTAIGASSYTWSNGATSSTITVSPLTTTNFWVRGSNGYGAFSIDTVKVIVNPLPLMPSSIQGDILVCKGTSIETYIVPSVTYATSYMWTLPQGATGNSITNSIVVSFGNNASSGNITVRGVNACGNGPVKSLAITVDTIPLTPASISGTSAVCKGTQDVMFSVTPLPNATSYVWTLPGGMTGSSTTNTIVVNFSYAASTGYISAKAANICGVGNAVLKQVVVNPLPIVSAGPDKILPQGNSVTLEGSADGNGANITTISWTPANGLSNPNILTPSANPAISTDYTLTVINSNGCSKSDDVHVAVIPAEWEYTQTSTSHVISIPLDADPVIDGEPLEPGDYIGIFFMDGGVEICGGAVEWNGSSTVAVVAYGDDDLTPWKDGFGDEENFIWKVFSIAANQQFTAVVEYDTLMPDHDGKFIENGVSALTSFAAYLYAEHLIFIPNGWSGISSYIDAENDSVAVLFEPIVSDLVIMLNMSQVYWPSQGINTIGTWNTHQGYKIKVENAGQLTFSGELDNNKTLNLNNGWSIIPVLNNDLVNASQLFSPLGDTLIIVKEIAGIKVYWPGQSIYSLINLEPGKAYMTATNAACTVTFPAYISSPYKMVSAEEVFANITPWNDINVTSNSHTIAIDKTALAEIKPGDVIGVFNTTGLCCGMLEVTDIKSPLGLTAFGDDFTTEELVDGLSEDEPMLFRLYRPGTDQEYIMNVVFDSKLPNDGRFRINGLSKIGQISLVPTTVGDNTSGEYVRLYPNPSKGIFYISFSNPVQDVNVSVYSDHGQLLRQDILNAEQENRFCQINLTEYPKGIYFIRFMNTDFSYYCKIIIQ